MGFEVIYHYHERLEEGGYNKEETKQLKRKVGDPYDDVPLEKLAASVMQQLARRDIWVTNFEVFEYTKKQITARETKGGIILKNKKFDLEGQEFEGIVASEIVEYQQPQQAGPRVVHPHELLRQQAAQPQPQRMPAVSAEAGIPQVQQPVQPQPPVVHPHQQAGVRRPRKFMTFEPYPHEHEVLQKGLKFTNGKRYPIYEERIHPLGAMNGVEFVTVDDLGREVKVSDKYFVPPQAILIEDPGQRFTDGMARNAAPEPKLKWDGLVDDDPGSDVAQMEEIRKMEALRRRRAQ